jgi:hypothetical protein
MLVDLCPWFGLQAAVRAYLSDHAERQGNTEASFKVRSLVPSTPIRAWHLEIVLYRGGPRILAA